MFNLNQIKINLVWALSLALFLCAQSVSASSLASVAATKSPQSVNIDFNDVDIRLVIKYLSELTQTNFVIDQDVSGKVSVMSPNKMTVEEAKKVLETLLVMNGYTIVEADGVKRVVPSNTARQSKMQTWVGKDAPFSDSEAKMVTQIVPLDYANADKVKEILIPYITGAGHVASYRPTNTLIISETTANLSKLLSIVRSLDDQAPLPKDDLRVISLKNADAKTVSSVLTALFEERRRQQTLQNRNGSDNYSPPSIVAHEGTNSLIVTASPQDYAIVEKTVKQMDIQKDQVYVEVLIVEMSMEKAAEYGLEFSQFGGVVFGSQQGFDGVNSFDSTFEGILGGGRLPGKAFGAVEGQTTKGNIQVPNVGLLLKAFDDDKDVNILSTPQITATDNEEARILVGNRIAFIKNSQVTAEGGTVATFEFREIGLELIINPHIGENDFVRLEVEQRTEDVIGQSFEGAPETAKRETRTTVSVRDNGTIVLGGLIRDETIIKQRKVPILGDIPILRAAFRSEETSVKKVNLLVFLTPHILRTSEQVEFFATQKREELERNYAESGEEIQEIEMGTLPQSAFKLKR